MGLSFMSLGRAYNSPNQLIEVNRRQSARFRLALEDVPGHHGVEGSVRRSPHQQR